MAQPSLRRRLLLAVFSVIVVFFALTIFLLDMLFRRAAERGLREVLDAQMVALVAAADPDGPESVTPTALLDTRFETPGSGLYAEIRSASGETIWRSQSTTGTDVQFGPPLEGGERQFLFTQIAGTDVELAVASRGIVWENLHGQSARFTFSVASNLETYRAQIASFRQQLVGWFSGVALLLLLTLMLILRWLSQPMRRLVREIKEVEAGGRERLSEHWPQELSAVTGNLNALLESERTRIKRYRDTLGNLAHSLKTPLAVMRQSLHGVGASRPESALDGEIERMTRHHRAPDEARRGKRRRTAGPGARERRADRHGAARGPLKVYGTRTCCSKIPRMPRRSSSAIAPTSWSCSATCSTTPASGRRSHVRIEATVDTQGRLAQRAAPGDRRRRPGHRRSRSRARAGARRARRRGHAGPWHRPGDGARHRGAVRRHDAIDASPLGGARFDLKLPGRLKMGSDPPLP